MTEEVEHFRRRRAAQVLTRWTKAKEAEPVHGFVMRLAAAHRETSAAVFLQRLAVHDIRVPSTYLNVLDASIIADPECLASLRRWTPAFPDDPEGTGELAGQTIRRTDWSTRTRRFCPACLFEDAFHRTWFDLTFFGTCPFHGLEIIDRSPNGHTTYFNRAAVDARTLAGRLSRPAPRIELAKPTIESYALGRLGLMPVTVAPMLDGATLGEVVEAAETLGRLKLNGWTEDSPEQGIARASIPAKACGFDVLIGGRPSVEKLFRDIAAQAPVYAHGERRIFGWVGTVLYTRGGLCGELHRIMCDVAVRLGRHHRRSRRPEDGNSSERISMADLAVMTGRSVDVVTTVVQGLGIMLPHKGGAGHPFLIETVNLDKVICAIDVTLSRTEAAAYLGLEIDRFNEVGRSGFLSKLGARWSSKTPGIRATGQEDRFEKAVLDEFLEHIPLAEVWLRTSRETQPESTLSVADALNMSAYDAGEFFLSVEIGQLRIEKRATGAAGLRDFTIEMEHQPRDHPFTKRCMSVMATRGKRSNYGMSLREVGAVLESDATDTTFLVDQGFLGPALTEEGTQYRLDRRHVMAFHRKYATAKVWAASLNASRANAVTVLRATGLMPAIVPVVPEGRKAPKPVLFFERDEVDAFLNLPCNPEALDHTRFVWKRFSVYLGLNQSGFAVWHINADRALVSDANRHWPAKVSYVFDDLPVDPDPDRFVYGIDVRMQISGKGGAERIPLMLQAARSRDVHPAIAVTVDPQETEFEARILITFSTDRRIDPTYSPARGMAFVAEHGEWDARVIERALYTIRASFEPSDRPYDHRLFGTGGFDYRRGYERHLDRLPLIPPAWSPRIEPRDRASPPADPASSKRPSVIGA